MKISCDKKHKPETPDLAQCRQCKNASAKKIWCCKFGFYFDRSLIATPSKKLILPDKRVKSPLQKRPKPTIAEMMATFTKAMLKWAGSGLKCVSKEEYIRRRTICAECHDGWRCPLCGCVLRAKVALATEKCPAGKW